MAGEPESFEVYVHARLPALLRFGYVLTGNPHDAADLVQDALERTGARWVAVRRRDSDAYVRRTMVNRWVSTWRRRRRRELLVAEVPEHAVPSGEVTDPALWAALRALPARQRAVLVLRYYEDLDEQQTAAALGCSVGTVKSQAARARARLRQTLSGPAPFVPPLAAQSRGTEEEL